MAQSAYQGLDQVQKAAQMSDQFVDILTKLDADIEIIVSEDENVKRKTFPGLKLGKEIPIKRDTACNSFTADQFDLALKQLHDARDHFDSARAGFARKTLVSVFEDRLAAAKVAGVKREEIEPVLQAFDEYVKLAHSPGKLTDAVMKHWVDKAWAVTDAFEVAKKQFEERVATEANDKIAKARELVAARLTKTTKKA